jgi:two-component system, NtrC family, response regulator AtoC
MPESFINQDILVVDDDPAMSAGIARVLQAEGYQVTTAASGEQALETLATQPVSLAILDMKMPGMDGVELLQAIGQDYPHTKVIMLTGYPDIKAAVACIKMGALDYLVKPLGQEDYASLLQKAQVLIDKPSQSLAGEAVYPEEDWGDIMVGRSPVMQKLFAQIRRAAPTDSTILLTGESGTGKELAAQAIHRLSRRADREFVPVDCSALVETLLESELFGHVKGSFTGAIQTKHGLFELANQGTFFFDEISNLSLNIQAKLLRVLQEREFMQVGSQKRIKLDIRIIASSNRDLKEAIKAGDFRPDLYYRLSVIPIHLPPLRDRIEDIPLLVDHFLRKYFQKCDREVKGISPRALQLLSKYSWPGNVRELEHTIERILILEAPEIILPKHLPSHFVQNNGKYQIFSPESCTLQDLEKRHIQFILTLTKGNRQEAARILGINRKTLSQKIKKYFLQGTSLKERI